jgi:hypothetical protein
MEDRLQDVLSGVDAKQGPSRLRHGFTCRDITALLAETCQFKTSKSAVSRLVRARARRWRQAARQISRSIAIPTPVGPKVALLYAGHGPSNEEVLQGIAAMKARKPAATPSDNGFYFDPTEPLRLIDPGKRIQTAWRLEFAAAYEAT